MKGALLVILLSSVSLYSSSQQPFNYQRDFQSILSRSKNATDSLYYGNLLQRFNKNDSTLTWYNVLALMIGFTAQNAYQPYKDIEAEDALHQLNQQGKFNEALSAAGLFLVTHPLNMAALNEKAAAFTNLQQADSAKYYTALLNKITSAMLLSGNGKAAATARFALGPKDGQHLLQYAGVPVSSVSSGYDANGNFLDIVQTKLEFGASVSYYFIIRHAKDKMYAGFSKAEIEKMKKEGKEKK